MILTYPLKNKIITHMSDLGRWENRFSNRGTVRKGTLDSHGRISAVYDKGGSFVEFSHKNGSVLLIESDGGKTTITDESGRVVVAVGSEVKRQGRHRAKIGAISTEGDLLMDIENVESAGLHLMNVRVGFNVKTGQKIVILPDHSGAKITFAKATTPKENPEVRMRLLHTVPFNRAAWGGKKFFSVAIGAVLVVARDLGLEPDLKAINEWEIKPGSEEAFFASFGSQGDGQYEFLERVEWQSDAEVRGNGEHPDLLSEKPWVDTTDFTGFRCDTPSSFMVEMTDDGFEISTSLDHRELVLSHGAMLEHVRNARVSSALTYNHKRGKPGNLLRLVGQGEIVENHRGQPWNCAVIQSSDAGATAQYARAVMSANFGLTGQHSAVISFRKGFTMVAMDQQAHSFAVAAQSATRSVVQAIKTGNTGGQTPIDFLQKQFSLGAALRRVDFGAYDGGRRTLATLMRDNERYELLDATRELVGLHNLNVA